MDTAEELEYRIEGEVSESVSKALLRPLGICREDNVHSRNGLVEHLVQKMDIFRPGIDHSDKVPERVFESHPGSGIGIHFLR